MTPAERIVEVVDDYCDLRTRLRDVPRSARIRGVFLNSVRGAMDRLGKGLEYRAMVPGERCSALRFYPVTGYLLRLAAAGALLCGAEEVHRGMARVSQENARAFADSLLGRAVLGTLSPDPTRLLRQGAAGRRMGCDYGSWSLDFPAPRTARMSYRREYVWIESALVGAARGTFGMIGIDVAIETRLDGAYSGMHLLRW